MFVIRFSTIRLVSAILFSYLGILRSNRSQGLVMHYYFDYNLMQNRDVEMTIRNNKHKPLVEQNQQDEFSQMQRPSNLSPKKSLQINLAQMKSSLKKANVLRRNKKFSWPVYKKLLIYTKKEWKLFLVSMISLLTSSFFTSLIPYITGKLLDKVNSTQNSQSSSFSIQYPKMLAFLIGLSISTYIRIIVTQTLQQRIAIHLRMDVFGSFITNDIYFFQLYKSGQLNSRVGDDINEAKSATSNSIAQLLRNITTIIGNICILMFMSWKLSLMILILIPLYSLVTTIHNRKTKMLVKQYQDVQAQASIHLNEIFTGMQVVKAFSAQDKEIGRYQKIQAKGYSINYLKAVFAAFFFSMSVLLPNVGILMVIWYGGNLVMSGRDDMTAGELTSFIMYCMALSKQATQISNGYSSIVNGTSAVQKVFEMMSYEPSLDEKGKKKFPDYKLGGEIQFCNVDFQYPKGSVLILKNLNFHIRPRQFVAFVGQSGSGKSTIVKLIERFYGIKNGKLTYDGIDAENMNIKNIRDQIGFVSQQAILFLGTIQENIVYGVNEYNQQELIEACKQSGCLQFINDQRLFPLGFKTTVGEKGNQLSGGQRQRISIARALIRKPNILIFDEATSALDSNSQAVVQKSIQNLISNKTNAMTIIAIAHRLSTIIAAHRIYVMKGGEIIESGDHQTLLSKNGYYSQLISKQLQSSAIKEVDND